MNASTNGTQHVMQGWTSSPDQRGTIDILFSCCLTTLLCCWTSVCPNVPAKNDSKWMQLQDKMNLAFMGLLGPEFLLMLALGQWASARRSVKMFRAAGYEQWTMTHAFFADMGGIMLQTPGYPEFPVDAEQLYYLIDKRYIEYPDIHKADIDDKNKSDGLARLITVCQTLWFTISCVARPLQSLSLTTIELTTLSFILLYLFISFAWRHKPIDVSRPLTLHTTTPISRIHSEGPPSARAPWFRTPLDFISRREYFMSLFWSYFTNLAYTLHIPLIHLFTRRITSRPHDRIRTDHFAATDALSEVLSAPLIGAYAVIFALAWDFEFPSRVEQMLWRASSVYMAFFCCVGGLYSGYCHYILLPSSTTSYGDSRRSMLQKERNQATTIPDLEASWTTRLGAGLRNTSPDQDPHLEIPLLAIVPITMICAVYCLFRVFILIEDLVGLRSLPPSAFESVSWSQFFPHV